MPARARAFHPRHGRVTESSNEADVVDADRLSRIAVAGLGNHALASPMTMKLCVWTALAITTGGLVACAGTGPMQIGKDTYTISVRVPLSGPSGAKDQALQEANAFCAKQNRQVLLDHENSYECALCGGCGEAEITFLCLAADDPRYIAPHQLRKDNGVLTTEGHRPGHPPRT